MSVAIYNEIEPFAADWLERLAERGHIAPGLVERRSITDLRAADVAGPGQRHFFAGIGGWSYALRRAGVADDANVWTGSCPCQPFSAAGQRKGFDDERHLWPVWFGLIRECRPSIVFGEQVAGPAGLAWLDAVRADLEGSGYAFGASVLSAAGVGAPHRRERLYFVAYADNCEWGQRLHPAQRKSRREVPDAHGRGSAGAVGDSNGEREDSLASVQPRQSAECSRGAGAMGNTDGLAGGRHSGADGRSEGASTAGATRSVADAGQEQRRSSGEQGSNAQGTTERREGAIHDQQRSGDRNPWSDAEWIPCRDPIHGVVYRPVEPGTFPLAHGVPARVGRLRGYGNAIVTETAIEFIIAAIEAIEAQ